MMTGSAADVPHAAPQARTSVLLEGDMKRILLRKLAEKAPLSCDRVVATELALDQHRRRVDVALFAKSFDAFEIKSDSDTLHRLPYQLACYLTYFDRVTVVSGPRHIANLKDGVPENVGLLLASHDGSLKVVRRPKALSRPHVDHLAQLLTTQELSSVCSSIYSDTQGMKRSELVKISCDLKGSAVRNAVQRSMYRRYAMANVRIQRGAVAGESLMDLDISSISRYHDRRMQFEAARRSSDEYWKSWEARAEEFFGKRSKI